MYIFENSSATDNVRKQGVAWLCDVCDGIIIEGAVYSCIQCEDYALCPSCFNAKKANVSNEPFSLLTTAGHPHNSTQSEQSKSTKQIKEAVKKF